MLLDTSVAAFLRCWMLELLLFYVVTCWRCCCLMLLDAGVYNYLLHLYLGYYCWQYLVNHFSHDFTAMSVSVTHNIVQAKSKRNISSRSYQDAGHTAGTQSFAQVTHEMFNKDKVMPDLLKFYEVVHTKKDKTPVTKTAQETLSKVQGLLAKRDAGEISLTNEEIYAEARPTQKRGRDRGKGVSPSITALYSSFGDAEKLRKEAEEAKKDANEAMKEANEANKKNEELREKVNDLTSEMQFMRKFMGKFLSHIGSTVSIEEMMNEELDEENESDDEAGEGHE